MLATSVVVAEIAKDLTVRAKFELGRQGGLRLNGLTVKRGAALYKTLCSLVPDLLDAHRKNYPEHGWDMTQDDFSVALGDELYSRLKTKQTDTVGMSLDEVYFNDSITTALSKLKIIYNVKNRRRSVIYDTLNDTVFAYDHDLTMDTLKARLGVDGRAEYLQEFSEQCIFSYTPGKSRLAYDKDGVVKHKIFNMWSEADWRREWTPRQGATLPALVKKFFDVFIDDPDDRKTLIAWLRDATFGKADPILILCGEPGIGKNLFVQKLATALVGKTNYREAARGFKDSAFHNNVSQCRLFFMDEMELTVTARDTLKAYHNGTAAIERKGIDVSDPEPIHASFVIANNFQKYIRLEYTDRKFFAPKLTKRPLEDKMSMAEIRELVHRLDNDTAFLQELGSYLFHAHKQGDSKDFVKTEFFEALCVQSYPVYFQRFIMACKSYEKFTNKTFNKTNRYGTEPFDIKTNLEHYKSTFKKPLATMEIRGDGSWTVTSEIFDPTILDAKPVVTTAAPAYKNGNGAHPHDEPLIPPPLEPATPML